MDELVRLAKIIKHGNKNNSTNYSGVLIGKVISVSPLQISDGPEVLLTKEDVIIARNYYDRMEVGHDVIMIATTSGQQYFVLDEVVKP